MKIISKFYIKILQNVGDSIINLLTVTHAVIGLLAFISLYILAYLFIHCETRYLYLVDKHNFWKHTKYSAFYDSYLLHIMIFVWINAISYLMQL